MKYDLFSPSVYSESIGRIKSPRSPEGVVSVISTFIMWWNNPTEVFHMSLWNRANRKHAEACSGECRKVIGWTIWRSQWGGASGIDSLPVEPHGHSSAPPVGAKMWDTVTFYWPQEEKTLCLRSPPFFTRGDVVRLRQPPWFTGPQQLGWSLTGPVIPSSAGDDSDWGEFRLNSSGIQLPPKVYSSHLASRPFLLSSVKEHLAVNANWSVWFCLFTTSV